MILKGELREQDKCSQGKAFERQEFWVSVLFGGEEGRGQHLTVCHCDFSRSASRKAKGLPRTHEGNTQIVLELRHLAFWAKRRMRS